MPRTEWVQYDRTAADGPRRTRCLGRVGSTTCYRSRGGEVTSERLTVCRVCEKPVVRPGQTVVTINERLLRQLLGRLRARHART